MASNLYAGKVITMGTLIAVFISTSDEAIPILASNPDNFGVILLIIGIKIVSAIVIGLLIDVIIKPKRDDDNADDFCASCHCHEKGGRVLVPAIIHTVKIFAFILVITLVLDTIMFYIGEERIALLLGANRFIQPFICALIGFIPNCAASVLLTDLFINGVVSFAGLTAGLCTGAGVGLAVLFQANKGLKENVKIIGILYVSGVVIGLITGIFVH
ncbi:MAG: putative manganese transporter, partial [Oscillospiraceae bacterium]